MSEPQQDITDRVLELITLNVRKVQLYRVAFADQPDLVYEGIPLPSRAIDSEEGQLFNLKIHTPEHLHSRTVQCAVGKVVMLEKVR